MKTLKQLNEARTVQLDIQDDAINYIDSADLNKYLTIAGKFISDEAKFVINWLIDHNNTYVKEFGGKNALETFYTKGNPSDESLKPLYTAIGKLAKKGRTMEIPVFQTSEQFNDIIDQKIAPDEILLDLTTEKGRNEVAKKYEPLVWKIARSNNGKSTFTLEELYAIGLEGLVWAMNGYGKASNKMTIKINNLEQKLKGELSDEEKEDLLDELNSIKDNLKKYKAYTFTQFAAYMIRCAILEAVKNESQTVRVPVSQQNKERQETGRNTKTNTISGDQTLGHDSEGNGKSLFDYMNAGEKGGKSIDDEDIEKSWDACIKMLNSQFDEKTLDIFYSSFGICGKKLMKKKDIAAKYNTIPSNITTANFKVLTYIRKNKKLYNLFTDIYTMLHESRMQEINNLYDETQHIDKVDKILDKDN